MDGSLIVAIIALSLSVIGGLFGLYVKLTSDIATSRHHMRNEIQGHIGRVELDCQTELAKVRDRLDLQDREVIKTLAELTRFRRP